MILIDSREPPIVEKYLRRVGLSPSRKMLEVGDVHLVKSKRIIVIERKDASDLVVSILDHRLYEQCYSLRCYESYLAVVGSISSACRVSNVKLGLVMSELARVSHHVRIVMFENLYQFALFVKYLYDTMGEDLVYSPVSIRKRDASPQDVYLAMLMCVPGIGRERAREIARYYPSLESLMSARLEELKMRFGRVGERLFKYLHFSESTS